MHKTDNRQKLPHHQNMQNTYSSVLDCRPVEQNLVFGLAFWSVPTIGTVRKILRYNHSESSGAFQSVTPVHADLRDEATLLPTSPCPGRWK